MNWIKSSRCGESTHCAEVAFTDDGVHVRDSKDETGPVLRFTRAEWDAFVAGAKDGEFDLLGEVADAEPTTDPGDAT